MPTKIEWCDETINPVVGCSKCSPGCDNCYAEKFAARLAKNPNPKISAIYRWVINERGQWNGRWNSNPNAFDKLRGAGKSVFLCSMGDLFHESVPQEHIDSVFNNMSFGPDFRFLVLTKRPARMAAALADLGQRWKSVVFAPSALAESFPAWPLPNVWLGVTVCNQAEAEEKIPILMSIPAAGHFVSAEPLLGPLDLMGEFPVPDWIIVGGETGPNARPMHPDWVRSICDQCHEMDVPFFFKSWGEHRPLIRRKFMAEGLRPFDYLPDGFDSDEWRHFDNYVFVNEDGVPSMANSSDTSNGYWLLKCGKKLSGRLIDGCLLGFGGREYNERPW